MFNPRLISLKKKCLAILSTFILLFVTFSGLLIIVQRPITADNSSNDDYAGAEIIEADIHTGSVNDTDNEDYYKIYLSGSPIITINYSANATGPSFQQLSFEDPTKWMVFSLYSYGNGSINSTYYLANETNPDYWYIVISSSDPEEYGNYTFKITLTYQNDGGTGSDVVGYNPVLSEIDYINASLITTESWISGELRDLDIFDLYKIKLAPSSIVDIAYKSDSPDSIWRQSLSFQDPAAWEQRYLYSNDDILNSTTFYLAKETTAQYWNLPPTENYWYILIEGDDAEEWGNYSFKVSVTTQDDAGTGGDVVGYNLVTDEEDYTNATLILTDTWISGELRDFDILDIYKIYLEPGYIVNITYKSNALGYKWVPEMNTQIMVLVDPTGWEELTLYSYNNIEMTDELTITSGYDADYWYILVDGDDDYDWGNYTFNVTVEQLNLISPEIFNVSLYADEYYVDISWETDVPTNGTMYYGLTDAYGHYEEEIIHFELLTEHYIFLSALDPGTYHFKIVVWDEFGMKNETVDDIFIVPRFSSETSNLYNSLCTFIFAEPISTRANSVDDQVKVMVNCYDKSVAITPDKINVTSAYSENEVQMNSTTTGIYTGTYTLTQDDIDYGSLILFADISYQGDNDSAFFSTELGGTEVYEDWEIVIDYFDQDDYDAGYGDTLNLIVTVTKDGVLADPENISVGLHIEEDYYRSWYDIPVPITKITTGEYKISYALPTEGNTSQSYDFLVEIENNEYYDDDYIDHYINVLMVWYHRLSITSTAAEYDLYITDLEKNIISNANIDITLEYNAVDDYQEKDQTKTTDASGKANFKFDYSDIDDDSFNVRGKVTAQGKTQDFSEWIELPEEVSEPEPWGHDLEILPVIADDLGEYSEMFAKPDGQGTVKRDYKAYSDSELLTDQVIYYYLLTTNMISNYYTFDDTARFEVVKTGEVTTNAYGVFSIDFTHSSTRNMLDYSYYYLLVESPVGTYEEFDLTGYASRDNMYYAEAISYFLVTDTLPAMTWEELISDEIKITMDPLNIGTTTDIEVTYAGSFVGPMAAFFVVPFEVLIDDPFTFGDTSEEWGQFGDYSGLGGESSLTKNNGKYTGHFTIPSFWPDTTYTIVVAFFNTEYALDEFNIYTLDYIHLNGVYLTPGNSIIDGDFDTKPITPNGDIDSDGDGYSDRIEKSFGTNWDDIKSYPGSSESQDFKEVVINNVEIKILGATEGHISIESATEVPEVPKDKGDAFGLFLEINCDMEINNITITIEIISIVPIGTDPTTVKLFYYDEEKAAWVEVKDSSYNAQTGILSAKLDHLTVFAPMTKSAGKEESQDDDLGVIMNYLIVITIIIVILGLLGFVMKKRGKDKVPEDEMLAQEQLFDAEVDETSQPPIDGIVSPPPTAGPEMPGEEQEMDAVMPETISEPQQAPESLGTNEPLPPGAQPQTISTHEQLIHSQESPLPPAQESTALPPASELPQPPAQFQPPMSPVEEVEPPMVQPSEQQAPSLENQPREQQAPPPEIQPLEQQAPPPEIQPPVQQAPPTESQPPTTAPEQAPQQQMVPCPTCKNMIVVYTTPCPHCSTSLNW